MRVYVLNEGIEYEGEYLLGVYATLNEAVSAANAFRQRDWGVTDEALELNALAEEMGDSPDTQGPDSLLIYEQVLGAAPKFCQDGNVVWRCYGLEPGEFCNLAAA